MIRDHFSLNAWGPGGGEFWVVRLKADWYTGNDVPGWYAIDAGLLGFCASLSFYPRGKYTKEPEPTWVAEFRERFKAAYEGREHGEAGE